MYGKELENTLKELAYGMDVLVKSTQRMVIRNDIKEEDTTKIWAMEWIITTSVLPLAQEI